MQTTADRMLGRYRLIGLLGRGGMADVYRAEDTRLDRIVAVKVIQSSYANDPAFLERFLREARIVAALDHPGILKIFDYGDDEGRPFLVMPHVTGGTLDSLRGPDALPADQVSRWIGQVADALDCAHARGVLHRDVKPGNVLIGSDGQAVLADFGIAKSAGASVSLTETGMVMGTPAYMAPELARGQPASRSTDLYALAAMTYELLTGRQPFIGENPLSVLHQHVTRPVPSVATTAPCLPRTLDRFFERAMAKDPALRPESGRALASGLAAATGEAKGISPGVSTRPMAGSLRARSSLPEPGDPSRGSSRGSQASAAAAAKARRPGRPFTIVALVALAAMAVLFAVDRFFSPASPHEDPAQAARPAPATGGDAAAAAGDASDLADRSIVAGPEAEAPVKTDGGDRARDAARDEPSAPETPQAPAESPTLDSLVRRVLEQHARPRLLTAAELSELARHTDAFRSALPGEPVTGVLSAFARAGVAYGEGDDDAATEALAGMEPLLPRLKSAGVGSFSLVPPESPAVAHRDWELAAIFGDVRREGMAAVDRRLDAEPNDPRARLARGLLMHMHGRHSESARDVARAYEPARAAGLVAAGELALFAAREHAEAGHVKDAVAWYQRAAEAGGRAAGPAAQEGAQLAMTRLGSRPAALSLLRAACEAGQPAACRRLSAMGGRTDRTRRQRR